jgi:hypothetical protein
MGLGVGMGLRLGLRGCVVGHGLLFLHHTRPGNHSRFHWMLEIKKKSVKKSQKKPESWQASMDAGNIEISVKKSQNGKQLL